MLRCEGERLHPRKPSLTAAAVLLGLLLLAAAGGLAWRAWSGVFRIGPYVVVGPHFRGEGSAPLRGMRVLVHKSSGKRWVGLVGRGQFGTLFEEPEPGSICDMLPLHVYVESRAGFLLIH